MIELSWLNFVIIILASFRLTHLIVFDEITNFIRKPFLNVSYEKDSTGNLVRKVDIKGKGFTYQIGLLLSCYWCVGIWSSIGLVTLYYFIPSSFFIHLILAVAGAAAFIESRVY